MGVFRPTRRVHLPLGRSYYDLTAVERSTLWAFERYLQSGELEHMTGAWIFRGIAPECSAADRRNLDLVGLRVVEGTADFEVGDDDDYEALVDSEDSIDHGWAKFVHIPASATALAA